MNNLQTEIIEDLKKRKKTSREFLRALSPSEKIARLVSLQEQYYHLLKAQEENGGRAIPEKWRKWHKARYEKNAAKSISKHKNTKIEIL